MRKATISMGLRLFFAGLILFLFQGSIAAFIVAAAVMTLPKWQQSRRILAAGAGDEDEKEKLLEEVTKQVKKIMTESANGMISEKVLNDRLDKLNKDIAEKLDDDGRKKLKGEVDKMIETNDKLQKDLARAQEDLSKTNENLNKQALEIKALKDSAGINKNKGPKAFKDLLRDAIIEQGKTSIEELPADRDYDEPRKSLKAWFEKNQRGLLSVKVKMPVEVVNKALVDMFESNIAQNYVNELRLTTLDPNRVGIPLTIYPHVTDVFASRRMAGKFMALLVVYEYEDGSGTKTEGSASTKSSFKLRTVSFPAFVIATHFVMSDETLDDLEEVLDEINAVAPDKIMDKIDTKILGATGDDASDIAGILTANKHTPFDNTLYLNSIEGANFLDVVACMADQINKGKYKGNAVYMNPTDVMFLAAAKNTFEDSRIDRRVQYDNLGNPVMFYGLRILKSEAIGIGEAIVLDLGQAVIGKKWEIIVEIGYNGTDLVEGQRTVVLKTRLAFGVRDKAAIVYSADVNAEIANITKTS